jgi:hypothetical protein
MYFEELGCRLDLPGSRKGLVAGACETIVNLYLP